MPKISIIVPVYKVEQYLRRCLDSIMAQTFTDWECILIDDGSPDNSGKICDEYAQKDGRFRVIHQENQGVSAARNAGLDSAKGEFVNFIDSDDWIEKELLTELYECAVTNNAEVVVSGVFLTDGTKKEKEYKVKDGWLNIPKDFEWYIQGPCAKLFSQTILHKYNIRFPIGITIAEDLYFTFQVYFNTNKIWGLESVYYNYFMNQSSAMHTITMKKLFDEVRVIEMIEKIVYDNKLLLKWEEYLLQKKLSIKDRILNFSTNVRPDLWRNTFPECNFKSLKYGNFRRKVLYLLIIMHCDKLIRFMKKEKK